MTETHDIDISLEKLEAIIGVTFTERIHLLTAITHRSYLNEHREAVHAHNERYEFLGDAVLATCSYGFSFS